MLRKYYMVREFEQWLKYSSPEAKKAKTKQQKLDVLRKETGVLLEGERPLKPETLEFLKKHGS